MAFTNERPLSVDNTRLDTYAYNIESIDGRRQLPGIRSNDVVVPGRHGEVPSLYDDFQPNKITLRMWVRSTDVNGNDVQNRNPKDVLSDNLDRLFALFRPRNRLLTVTQQVGPDTGIRSGYLKNPRHDSSTSTSNVRVNYILNPSMDRSTSDIAYRTNLIPNPSFEVGTTSWSTLNSTLARVAGGAPAINGAWRGEFTATGTDPWVNSAGFTVVVDDIYTGSAYIGSLNASGVEGGDPRVRIGIRWVNAAVVVIQEDWTDPFEVTAAWGGAGLVPSWQRVFISGQAPTGAVTGRLTIQAQPSANGDPVPVGAKFVVDGALFEEPTNEDQYFDGATPDYGAVWTGTAHNSISQAMRGTVDNWASVPGAGQVLAHDNNPANGTRCMAWRAIDTFGEEARILWNQNSLPNDNLGSRWSVSIHVRTPMDDPPRIGLQLAGCDASGNFVAYALRGAAADSGVATAIIEPVAGWRRWVLPNLFINNFPGTVTQVRLEIVAVDEVPAGALYLFDAATLEPLATTPHYFDGDSGDTPGLAYAWASTADNSYSLMKGGTVDNWTGTRGTLAHTADTPDFAVPGSRALGRYTVTSNSGGISFSNFMFSTQVLCAAGTQWNGGAFVKGGTNIEMAQVSIESFNGASTSVLVSRGVPTDTSAGWTWVPGPAAGVTTPSGSDRVRFNIHFWKVGDIVPTAGAVAYVNGACLATGLGPVEYFDEKTGGVTVKTTGRMEKLPDLRHAICKTDAAIEASDAVVNVAGGYTQRFSVSLKVPDVFWRDTGYIYWQSTFQPVNKIRLYEIEPLAESTAPIEDGVFVVIGPANKPYLQDPETGWFCRYNDYLPPGQSWRVDAGRYLSGVARTGTLWSSPSWRSVLGRTDYESGRSRMFTLHPRWDEGRQKQLVRIQMFGGIRMYTIAKRKFL